MNLPPEKCTSKYKAVIFDLDGTLLDTLEDLADSLNYALALHGFPCRTQDEVRQFVGNGMKKLIERGLGVQATSENISKVHASFTSYYEKHCTDKTKPYAGIEKILLKIKSAGIKLAVVSNKDDLAVKSLCSKFFPDVFDFCVGAREGISKKPASDGVLLALKHLGCEPKDALYIGDSEVDIATAKNAGVAGMCVAWGFRSEECLRRNGAEKIARNTEELAQAFSL